MDIHLVYWDYNNEGTEIFSSFTDSFPPYQIGQYIYLRLNNTNEAPDYYIIKEIAHHVIEQVKGPTNQMDVFYRMDIVISIK